MAEEIFDVISQSTGWFEGTMDDWERFPPPQSDFYLGSEFWLGRLPHGVKSAAVFDACEPAGFNFQPIRQFGCRYSFCRKVSPPSSDHFSWDHDGILGRTLFLSRLIHPTTIAPHYSARLFFEDGALKMIVPGRVQDYATYVWIVAHQWRDWLSETEAQQLRQFLPTYDAQPPDRVRRARMHIDYAFHGLYLEQRTASLVSSFESLLKVERSRATAQFALRVPALAQMVGTTISRDEAELIYDDRSVFVHGRVPNFTDVSDEIIERYNRFEGTLRLALLRASTDAHFSAQFSTDAAVLSAFGSLP